MLSLLVLPPSATATNWGSSITNPCDDQPTSECIANNGAHHVYMDFLPATWQSEHLPRFAEYDAIPDVSMDETTQCCVATTDVREYDGVDNPGTVNRAWTICPAYATVVVHGPHMRSCTPQLIYYNNGAYPLYYDTENERKAIFCHELGHTLGLRHATSATGGPDFANSCMKAVPGTKIHLTQHDKDILAAKYPLP